MNSLNGHLVFHMPEHDLDYIPDLAQESVLCEITSQIGVMISPPPRAKGRSIAHCCRMMGQKHISVERKYDGEYCQIHVDMSNKAHLIKIFSKSGRDSTQDRIDLHAPIGATSGSFRSTA